MFNYDCVSFSSSIVNVPYVIILSVSICISSLLVWISINTFKTYHMLAVRGKGKGSDAIQLCSFIMRLIFLIH